MSLIKVREMQTVRAEIDPHTRLAFGVLKKALKDLNAADPLVALDALLFWLDEGPDWLIMLGIEPSDTYLKRLIEGCENESGSINQYTR